MPVYADVMREWLGESRTGDIELLRNLVFDQLICQRLQRGFQIVLLNKRLIHAAIGISVSSQTRVSFMAKFSSEFLETIMVGAYFVGSYRRKRRVEKVPVLYKLDRDVVLFSQLMAVTFWAGRS